MVLMSDSGSPVPPPIFLSAPAAPAAPPVPPALPPIPSSTSPAPRRRTGRAWFWWSLTAALLLFVGLCVVGIYSAVERMSHLGSFRTAGAGELTETVVESHNSKDKIAVIPVEGVIASGGEGGSMVDLIRGQLERAADDDHVKAVVLRIDSPGGEVLASDEIADALREFQIGPKGKPVVVSMQSICASGGYYISAPCRWIVAHELTITGSIGVIFHGYNYRGLMEKLGVRPKVTKSGKLKDMWSPDKLPEEELPEEREIMQELDRKSHV